MSPIKFLFDKYNDLYCAKQKNLLIKAKMIGFLNHRFLYGLVVPSTAIIIGGIVWYYNRRKSQKKINMNICFI